MCGIVGLFHQDGEPVGRDLVKRMTASLAHRGPDGEGLFVDGPVGLGHRRLAILDTSDRGAQPMRSKDGRWVVVFNGCIYNFQELREELRARGHIFHSSSDTEVLVEGLAAWGPGLFPRLNGMFAVGAWCVPERRLYISRDRYGVKPLYFWTTGESFAFASEIKAFLAHPKFRVAVDPGALNEYFTFQNLFTYRTLFQGVYMLPQANTIAIDADTRVIRHAPWWDYDFSAPDETMSFDEAKDETKRLMKRAVARQMVADVPVGSYLSGGMDSGSITAIASGHVPRLATFTGGFDLSEVTGVEANYDERRDAELMAYHFGTEHYEQVLNTGDLSWSLPRLVWHLEDLKVGMSYPNYYISRLASKFVKVCLQGTGGDELFGGYPWRYYRVMGSLDRTEFFRDYYDFWQRLVPDDRKGALFTPAVAGAVDPAEPRRIFERVFTFNEKLKYDRPEEHIQNSLYFEIKTFLPGLLLVGDKLAMANALEERFPFLDNDLVAFAQRIPVRHKLADFDKMTRLDENLPGNKRRQYTESSGGKNVLRAAMADFIPESILHRRKQGFSAPDESWYRGRNAAYIADTLLGRRVVSAAFIEPAFVRRVLAEHNEKRINHRLLIWSLLNFEWWCRIFLDGDRSFAA